MTDILIGVILVIVFYAMIIIATYVAWPNILIPLILCILFHYVAVNYCEYKKWI